MPFNVITVDNSYVTSITEFSPLDEIANNEFPRMLNSSGDINVEIISWFQKIASN